MKKIIFVRHARAEEQANGISDYERSLTIKGKTISRQMARRFKEKEPDPGILISSPAFRALETGLIFANELGIKPESMKLDSNLYFNASLKNLFELVAGIDDSINTITLFGHNPAFTEMPDRLCRDGCEFMTKTSVVCISFQARLWSDVKVDSGRQEYFLKPEKQS